MHSTLRHTSDGPQAEPEPDEEQRRQIRQFNEDRLALIRFVQAMRDHNNGFHNINTESATGAGTAQEGALGNEMRDLTNLFENRAENHLNRSEAQLMRLMRRTYNLALQHLHRPYPPRLQGQEQAFDFEQVPPARTNATQAPRQDQNRTAENLIPARSRGTQTVRRSTTLGAQGQPNRVDAQVQTTQGLTNARVSRFPRQN